jgi:hypothetical protein
MRELLLLLLLSLFLIPGCMESEFSGRQNACLTNHTSADCSPAALDYAILKKDRADALAMCNAIDAPAGDAFLGSAKDRCYMQVAEALQDSTICNQVGLSVTRSLCVQNSSRPLRTPLCGIAFVLPALAALALFIHRN